MSEKKKDQISYTAEIEVNLSLEGGKIKAIIVTAPTLESLHDEIGRVIKETKKRFGDKKSVYEDRGLAAV